MRRLIRTSVLAVSLAVSPLAMASEADGTWSVSLVTQKGDCTRSLSSSVRVRDGRIDQQGLFASVSGAIDSSGNVAMRVVKGSETIAVNGAVQGLVARGAWTSATSNCSGRWTAMRS